MVSDPFNSPANEKIAVFTGFEKRKIMKPQIPMA
jgi:hypothetical protein